MILTEGESPWPTETLQYFERKQNDKKTIQLQVKMHDMMQVNE